MAASELRNGRGNKDVCSEWGNAGSKGVWSGRGNAGSKGVWSGRGNASSKGCGVGGAMLAVKGCVVKVDQQFRELIQRMSFYHHFPNLLWQDHRCDGDDQQERRRFHCRRWVVPAPPTVGDQLSLPWSLPPCPAHLPHPLQMSLLLRPWLRTVVWPFRVPCSTSSLNAPSSTAKYVCESGV